jgi:hypothetical protein
MQHTRRTRIGNVSPAIRAGHSTLPQPRAHGSMPSRVSLLNRPGGGSNLASSIPSSTCKPPSTASSENTTTPTPSPSSGKPLPTTSPPLEIEGSKRWSQSTSAVRVTNLEVPPISLYRALSSFRLHLARSVSRPLRERHGPASQTMNRHSRVQASPY